MSAFTIYKGKDISSFDQRLPLGEPGHQGIPDPSAAGNVGKVEPNVKMDEKPMQTYASLFSGCTSATFGKITLTSFKATAR